MENLSFWFYYPRLKAKGHSWESLASGRRPVSLTFSKASATQMRKPGVIGPTKAAGITDQRAHALSPHLGVSCCLQVTALTQSRATDRFSQKNQDFRIHPTEQRYREIQLRIVFPSRADELCEENDGGPWMHCFSSSDYFPCLPRRLMLAIHPPCSDGLRTR